MSYETLYYKVDFMLDDFTQPLANVNGDLSVFMLD
jgi:hypothetical protein